MNFIKKVFEGEADDSIHLQFQKFSRGEFGNRALIKAKKSKGKYVISTGSEFANDFVSEMAEKLGNKKTSVSGVIVSTLELEGLDYQSKKQFMGIKQYAIRKEMTGNEILELLDKFPKAFFGLSFEVDGNSLKIKAKAPKSAKPSTKAEEKPKVNFCKLTTGDLKIMQGFVWEAGDFKNAEINHTFAIEDIIIPPELKSEKDFAKIRETAKRKGKILRKAMIDGKEIISEKEFSA